MIVSIKLFVSYIISCQLANTINAPSNFFFFLLYVALKKLINYLIHQFEIQNIILFKNLRKYNIFLPHSLFPSFTLSLSLCLSPLRLSFCLSLHLSFSLPLYISDSPSLFLFYFSISFFLSLPLALNLCLLSSLSFYLFISPSLSVPPSR